MKDHNARSKWRFEFLAQIGIAVAVVSLGMGCGGGATSGGALKAEKKSAVEETQIVTVRRPAMVLASEWGSVPTTMPASASHEPKRITIHHAGVVWKPGDEPVKKLTALQKWGQKDKNWPDLPYHYLIAPDGMIYEGRPTAYKPETNTAYDTTGHVGIMLWGNLEIQRPTQAQVESAVMLSAWLCKELNLKAEEIAGHMNRAETTCPGKDMQRYIASGEFQTWVKNVLEGKPSGVVIGPALEGGPTISVTEPLPPQPATLPTTQLLTESSKTATTQPSAAK